MSFKIVALRSPTYSRYDLKGSQSQSKHPMVNVSLATYTYCIHVRSILTKCFLEWSTLSLKKWLDHLGYQYLHDSRTSTEPQQTMSLATHLRQSSSTVSGPSYIDQKIEIRIKMSNVVRVAEQCFTRFICKRTPLQVQT